MTKATENNIQAFWSDNPMIHPGGDFDWRTSTPEDIFAHVEGLMRSEKGTHFQGSDAPILDNFIDYDALRGKTVLEIGYGVGWLINELSKVAAEAQGIDLSKSHFALSSHRFRDTENVHLQVPSAEAIPFPDGYFDFVASYGVIHHAADDQKCYDEVRRVLKPGGCAFLMLYRKGGPKYWWQKMFKQGLLKGGLFRHRFNVASFINSVTDAYDEDSPGAPISRHYTMRDLERLLGRFAKIDVAVTGNRTEWDFLPAAFLPLTNWLLSRAQRDWLLRHSAAYWMVTLEK
ncbi:MAG: class I SAM-dependent methyltransferase [Rhodospirillaceae bacterium]|jgi:SAM-dependent methyltransferase|nr:class I SAM-dependent methyltransferase [Rhodospirillaceae bacterium]MBT5666019.1 class I SAM-dependent methyltransferase [Rhodospirillaceae bacterium]MBT5810862.1 class I SAM-dependent methyltransferase [Rhodospirillaceae bacterium]